MSDGCVQCGRHPAAEVDLRSHTGRVVSFRWTSLKASLCRDCGMAQFRDRMNHTLAAGWWGLVAFFVNFYAIAKNLVAWRKLAGLAPPSGAPTAAPADPGRLMPARSGVWITLVLGIVLASVLRQPGDSPTHLAGRCVDLQETDVHKVACKGFHDGMVLRVVPSVAQCPATTDDAVRLRRDVTVILCIDEDR